MTTQYSIKDLERISGIKAHTIRIWEKRYNIVEPERTESNIRFYCDSDLKRILNISVLINSGLKISRIAKLSDHEINKKILELNSIHSPGQGGQIESLVVAMIDLDEVKFEQVLNKSIISIGFEDTLFKVIYPLLSKIGVLWQIGTITPSHEHFMTNLIRQKLFAAIDNLVAERKPGSKTFLLALPQWELHDIGLLVYNYLIRKNGHKAIFLGQGIPLEDVVSIVKQANPDAIITTFSSPTEKDDIINYLRELSRHFDGKPIFTSGLQMKDISGGLPKDVKKLATVIEFRDKVLSRI